MIAGRATPKADVTILDGGKEIGKVAADNRGEWVFVPSQPLPPGSRELSLKETNPDSTVMETDSPVVLIVPEQSKEKGPSLAFKVNPNGTIDILQGPEAKAGAGTVSIGAIKYDTDDRLAVLGKADANAEIQAYLDEKPLGHSRADEHGTWKISGKTTLAPGNHTIRIDEMDANGKVKARAEIVFAPAGSPTTTEKITVFTGNSLWRIARRAYGNGFDYVIIYQANKDQIRDPNRIYPGQVFTIPAPH